VLDGGIPTERSDIYSVGSTLYTMLTGRPPFHGPRGETLKEYRERALQGGIPPLSEAIPTGLAAAIMRSLEKAPDKRFGSAGELRDALRDTGIGASGRPVPA
jgi:serine/threonine protein kinase